MASARAQALHASPWMGVAQVTGGGSGLLSEWLTTPGASRTVLEATVPYAFQALTEQLGAPPEQAASQATSRALAMAAYERAVTLASHTEAATGKPLFGLAVTASLATDRRKRGAHRAHVALQTSRISFDACYQFSGTRAQEEKALLAAIWACLADILKLPILGSAPEPATRTLTRAPKAWQELLAGARAKVAVGQPPKDEPRLLLPGSFNPLHDGHREMMAVAEQRLKLRGAFELSAYNVDKPALDFSTLKERAAAFRRSSRRNKAANTSALWFTRLPTFIEKARAFPNSTFAVGADTIVRIGQTRYYENASSMRRAIGEIGELGCRFLVFGRLRDEEFRNLTDLKLPRALRALCSEVIEAQFRRDLSSTALRALSRN